MRHASKGLLVALTVGVVAPLGAVALLSLSPSSAMDFYSRWPPSLRWWRALLLDNQWHMAFVTSVLAGAASAAIAFVVVVPSAVYARLTGSRTASMSLGLSSIPLAIPPIVLAVGLYQLILRLDLFDTVLGLVVAHLPFTVATISLITTAGFRSESIAIYHTARALGASPPRAAMTWLNACQRFTLASAVGVAVLISMSEATVSLYVTDIYVVPLSRKVLSGISRDINPTGFAAMAMWVAVLLPIATFLQILTRNRGTKNERGYAGS